MTDNKEIIFGVMLLRNNTILLGKRYIDPTWTMPGGKLEFQETFEQGAKREVKEETSINLFSIEMVAINNDLNDPTVLGFLSEDFSGEPTLMEPKEITQWEWFDLNNLPSPLYFPTEKILKNYFENKFN